MNGSVTPDYDAALTLRLQGTTGEDFVFVTATIDTGFTEFLLLERRTVETLGLVALEQDAVILGDGTLALMDVFEVDLEWNGAWCRIKSYGGEDETLVGVSLLANCRLTIDFVPGGEVRVEPI